MPSQKEREELLAEIAKRGRCKNAIPREEIARGAHLCWYNAVALLGDARLLAADGRAARVLSMTILALEELAKPALLWEMRPSDDLKTWSSFWKEKFSRHSPKQEAIGTYGQLLSSVGQGTHLFTLQQETVRALDAIKQWCFYVVDGAFQEPAHIHDKIGKVLDFLFAVADERADSFAQLHSSSEQSL